MSPETPSQQILIVEDGDDMRELVELALSDRGFSTHAVSDGNQALESIDAHSFDAAVVDMWMPELTGLELMERLRERRASLPVIFVSGFVTDDVREQAAALGAVCVLPKPFRLEQLIDAVEAAVS